MSWHSAKRDVTLPKNKFGKVIKIFLWVAALGVLAETLSCSGAANVSTGENARPACTFSRFVLTG